jgi:hypothetical protein
MTTDALGPIAGRRRLGTLDHGPGILLQYARGGASQASEIL